MNLRDIKKDIEYVLGAFIEDCTVVAAVNDKVEDSAAAELMEEAINLYNELRDKAGAKLKARRSLIMMLFARKYLPELMLFMRN